MDHRTMGGTKVRPAWIIAAGLVVVALVALGVPLVSLFYVGVLLLCPLLMAGMHGGHGQGHDRGGRHEDRDGLEDGDPGAPRTWEDSPRQEGGRT